MGQAGTLFVQDPSENPFDLVLQFDSSGHEDTDRRGTPDCTGLRRLDDLGVRHVDSKKERMRQTN